MLKLLLALTTSTEKGSLGLFSIQNKQIKLLSLKKWAGEKGHPPAHSEKLPAVIEEVLDEAKIKKQELDILALDVGPGRFTGVRVGISVMKTIAFAMQKPVSPMNSLHITAEKFFSYKEPLAVAFNSFKNSVYYAVFSKGKSILPPSVISFEKWKEKTLPFCVGDLKSFYELPKRISFEYAFPEAERMASLFLREKNLISWQQVKPLYLRSI